jgi:hypothetical protein
MVDRCRLAYRGVGASPDQRPELQSRRGRSERLLGRHRVQPRAAGRRVVSQQRVRAAPRGQPAQPQQHDCRVAPGPLELRRCAKPGGGLHAQRWCNVVAGRHSLHPLLRRRAALHRGLRACVGSVDQFWSRWHGALHGAGHRQLGERERDGGRPFHGRRSHLVIAGGDCAFASAGCHEALGVQRQEHDHCRPARCALGVCDLDALPHWLRVADGLALHRRRAQLVAGLADRDDGARGKRRERNVPARRL